MISVTLLISGNCCKNYSFFFFVLLVFLSLLLAIEVVN